MTAVWRNGPEAVALLRAEDDLLRAAATDARQARDSKGRVVFDADAAFCGKKGCTKRLGVLRAWELFRTRLYELCVMWHADNVTPSQVSAPHFLRGVWVGACPVPPADGARFVWKDELRPMALCFSIRRRDSPWLYCDARGYMVPVPAADAAVSTEAADVDTQAGDLGLPRLAAGRLPLPPQEIAAMRAEQQQQRQQQRSRAAFKRRRVQ